MRRLSTLLLLFVLAGCATQPVYRSTFHDTALRWYSGTVEQAFADAKKTGKPVFLYWGAVWCPPCNEIKTQVFLHADFPPLMDTVIPVYLDGDTEAAQVWGERLKVRGYPTLLVLSPNAQEWMRISSFVTFEEFKKAFQSAVLAREPFVSVLEKAAKGKANDRQWRILAFFDWENTPELKLKSEEILQWRQRLSDSVPRRLRPERALLAASVLEAGASADKKSAEAKKIQAKASTYLERVFFNNESILAARSLVVYGAKRVLTFAYPEGGKERERWDEKWIEAARFLRAQQDLSVDTRLWTFFPEIQIYDMNNPKTKVYPDPLAKGLEASVKAADAAVTMPMERQAVITGAAYLLRTVHRYEQAEALLKNELEISTSPWYVQASLASLEEARGNKQAAMEWSAKARKSAEGRATRLQWVVSDLELTAKLDDDKNHKRLKRLVRELYDVAVSLRDGFVGRNFTYLEKAQALIKREAKKDPGLAEAAFYFLPDCEKYKGRSKKRCEDHFKSFEKLASRS
ncbi:MAG: thioredoxin family protein [Bdellovibrionota bacterium]